MDFQFIDRYQAELLINKLTGGNSPEGGQTLVFSEDGWRYTTIFLADGIYYFPDGTVLLPGLAPDTDKDSGFYVIGPDNLGIALNGVKVVDLASALIQVTTAVKLLTTLEVDGITTLKALLDLSDAAAGQIKFPATQNASSDPNTLDDYEEGTWTPSIGGTATYNAANFGIYTKNGRLVTIQGRIAVLLLGTGNTGVISGLPFTSAGHKQSICIGYFGALAISPVFLSGYVASSSTTINLTGLTAAAAAIIDPIAVLGDGADIAFTATYYV